MYRNLLIVGPSRCGKTTLSRLISEKYDCNVINLDNLIESYEKTFPKTEEYDNYLKEFLINYFNQLSEYKNFYYDKKIVFEGKLPYIEDIINGIDLDKISIIGITYDNINIDYFAQKIKESEVADYLQFLSDNSLRNYLNDFIGESIKMTEAFDKYGIVNYDVSDNREETFGKILDDVEEYTKYGSTYKVKKLN